MLTATYTLVALSVEQAKVRASLQSLQQVVATTFHHQSALTPGQVSYACDAVHNLYSSCHWRKLDMYLIPAIRIATRSADELLSVLDQLGHVVAEAAGMLTIRLGTSPLDSPGKVEQFCAAIDKFCGATLQRLDLEEQRLFPVARAVISGEAWFSIANQMLAHQAYVQESRPIRSATLFSEPPGETVGMQRAAAQLVH